MKIAVLGAGHGGQAMAADLTISGHEVRFAAIAEHSKNLTVIKAFGGIYVEGVTSSGKPPGFAKIDMITTDVAAAINGAEVIMVVVPAFGQEIYMREIINHGEKGQIVVFNPGKFASLYFARLLKNAGRYGDFIISETDNLIYAAKMSGPGHVRIKACKTDLYYAAFPSVDTALGLSKLLYLFPQFTPAKNVLQTSIDDTGITLHVITTLMNTSRIEQMGPYRNSHYDITPSIGKVITKVDEERLLVSKTLRYETMSFCESFEMCYGVKGKNAYDVIMSVQAYNVQTSPDGLKHRYISEEVPFGLVPIASIARIAGIKTPGIDCFIQLASMANEIDYWSDGRSAETMDIEDFDISRLVKYVTYGPEIS